jgi:hypothetical protein
MNLILLILILLLLFGGLGGGYWAHSNYGGYYGPGIGIGAILLVVLLFILLRGY